jgi:hypothetical protein
MGRLATRFRIQLRTDAPDEFRRAAYGREHSAQEKQIPSLHRLYIRAKRLWRFGKLDVEFLQPLFRAGFGLYHWVRKSLFLGIRIVSPALSIPNDVHLGVIFCMES